jgi:hypothetical protein
MKWACLVVLVFIAVYLRVVVVQQTYIPWPLTADSGDYYWTALNIRNHGIYGSARGMDVKPPQPVVPDDWRPPGLPLIIAAVLAPSWQVTVSRTQLIFIILGAVTVGLSFWAAASVLPLPLAFFVGLLVACSPHLLSLTTYILTETPATFLTAVLLGLSVFAPSQPLFFAMGVVIGLSAMFRPIFLALAPVMVLVYPADKKDCLLFVCLGAAMVAMPWFVRNWANVPEGGLRPFAENLFRASFTDVDRDFPFAFNRDPNFAAAARSIALSVKLVARKIWHEPLMMARWYLLEKPIYLFRWDEVGSFDGDVFIYPTWNSPFWGNKLFQAIHAGFRHTHAVMLGFVAVGAVAAWFVDTPVVRVSSLLLIFTYFAHIPFQAFVRYTLPILPAMYLLAMFTIVASWQIGRKYYEMGCGVSPSPMG